MRMLLDAFGVLWRGSSYFYLLLLVGELTGLNPWCLWDLPCLFLALRIELKVWAPSSTSTCMLPHPKEAAAYIHIPSPLIRVTSTGTRKLKYNFAKVTQNPRCQIHPCASPRKRSRKWSIICCHLIDWTSTNLHNLPGTFPISKIPPNSWFASFYYVHSLTIRQNI